MLDIWSLLTCTNHRPPKNSPATNEYLKACFAEPVTYRSSICDAVKTQRPYDIWVISVVGAPEQKAVEILNIVYQEFKGEFTEIKLRWWNEAPPDYDCKSVSKGKWVGYDRENGSFDVPQLDYAASITLLYYSNGHDPFILFEDIPDGEFILYETARMLLPVSDYVFEKRSCETVVCSQYCPLYEVKSEGSRYYSPVPIAGLATQGINGLLQQGGEMRTLGEMNGSMSSYKGKRSVRTEACNPATIYQ